MSQKPSRFPFFALNIPFFSEGGGDSFYSTDGFAYLGSNLLLCRLVVGFQYINYSQLFQSSIQSIILTL